MCLHPKHACAGTKRSLGCQNTEHGGHKRGPQITSVWLSCSIQTTPFISLVPGNVAVMLYHFFFKLMSRKDDYSIFCEIGLRWMSQAITQDQSTLVQVMAWCRQSTSHYLSQWWPRSMLPYGVTRPQWVIPYTLMPLSSVHSKHVLACSHDHSIHNLTTGQPKVDIRHPRQKSTQICMFQHLWIAGSLKISMA